MNKERLIDHLKFEERCNLNRHLVDKKPHIGWGRCLQTKGLTNEELLALGYEDEDDIQEITQEQADYLFKNDIEDAIADASAVCEEYWNTLTPLRQEVLVSMAYNLGRTGLRKFRRMHTALLKNDFDEAANQMLDSEAAREQAPARYQRLAAAMQSNSEKPLQLTELYDTADTPTSLVDYSDDEIKTEYDRRFGEDPSPNGEVSSPDPEQDVPDGVISAGDLANELLNQIVIPHNAREVVMVPETGEMVKVQPFRLTDSTYHLPTKDELVAAIEKTKVDEIEYKAEEWDCEDFARRFVSKMHEQGIKTAGRVMAWSGNHAFNIVAVQGDPVEFVFVEAQTDEIVDLGKGNYNIENCLIVIS